MDFRKFLENLFKDESIQEQHERQCIEHEWRSLYFYEDQCGCPDLYCRRCGVPHPDNDPATNFFKE